MSHSSGVVYEGLWINNLPAVQPAEITIELPTGQTCIEIVQGKKFSLRLQLVNAQKEPIAGNICCITCA